MSTIGENIKRIRKATIIEKPMNRSDLAEKSGVSNASISLIERGVCQPNSATMVKIAGALGVDVGELFKEKGE